MTREQYVRRMIDERANWLEDVLAGLLSNGVRMDEIEVCEFQGELRTQVRVRGVPKYEWTGHWVVKTLPTA